MKHLRVLATAGPAAALLSAAAFSSPTIAPPAPSMNAAQLVQAKALYSEKCSACHDLPDPAGKDYTREEWQRTVTRMMVQHGASDSITPVQEGVIVDYLSTFAPAVGPGAHPIDPWATDSLDVWNADPIVTRVFTFVSPDSLSEFSAIETGSAGPAAVWSRGRIANTPGGFAAKEIPLQPSPNRFSLLIDKKDVAKQIDVRARFRIIAGKTTPAVGIACGYVSPKNYTVLIYNQLRNTLSLVEIANGVHTTLQSTPINLNSTNPDDAPPPMSTTGWHTLRLLINQGQVRGWLDETKRISVADPSYNGGKIGLWTQGDAVAEFADFSIDDYDGASEGVSGT